MTIPSLLREAARLDGGKAALHSMAEGPVSYAELDRQADMVARAMIADGAQPGERTAIWAPNLWEWVAAAVGVQRAGGTIIPLNTRLKGAEVADIVRRAKARRIITIGTFLSRYYPGMLRDQPMPDLRKIIVLRSTPSELGGIEVSWEAFLEGGAAIDDATLQERERGVSPDTISDIMFTSGTTGAPKGAVFDHRRSIAGASAWRACTQLGADDQFCAFGPFSHNASYKGGWVTAMKARATLHWPDTFDAETMLELISRHRISVLPVPPTVFQEMLAHPNWRDWDTSSIRFISTGGTVVPIELMKRLAIALPHAAITAGYGMTECTGSATHTRPGDPIERVAYTVGTAIEGTEISISGQDGRRLGPGEAGEVLIRSNKLLIEYLDNPEATRATLDADGWLHSGDVGVLDADGYLRITDRLKDMYIVGGFNVYPAEIEKQMGSLPGLYQVSIVGAPDARLGEVGHAFIVRSQGSTLDEAEVTAWCKANLANYKVPRSITFLDELPMNLSGKVLKFELKKLLGG